MPAAPPPVSMADPAAPPRDRSMTDPDATPPVRSLIDPAIARAYVQTKIDAQIQSKIDARRERGSRRVQRWLASVEPSSPGLAPDSPDSLDTLDTPDTSPPPPLPPPELPDQLADSPPAKRARLNLPSGTDSFPYPFNALPRSPPTSQSPPLVPTMADEMPPPSRPRKRGAEGLDQDDSQSDASDHPPTGRPTIPRPPRRTTTRADISQYTKPVKDRPMPPAAEATTLPEDIRALYTRIRGILHGMQIIPVEVRDEVSPDIEFPLPHYFRDPVEGADASARASAELDVVRDIVSEATYCSSKHCHESSWNNFVHTPLLKLAVPRPGGNTVRFEAVMNATIAGDSIPLYRRAGDCAIQLACSVSADDRVSSATPRTEISIADIHSRSSSKKVDYVLALDLAPDDPLQQLVSQLTDYEASVNGTTPHVNQTMYPALLQNLIAVSIETKRVYSASDPLVQLGTWVAAWHKRMEHLRWHLALYQRQQAGSEQDVIDDPQPDPSQRLVSLPLLQVVGHTWSLYFACDTTDSIVVYGPMTLGSTENVKGVYAVLSGLKAIKSWVEDTFRTRMAEWFS